MLQITETIIKNKGLDYIRELDSFFVWGNHYFPYPNELRELKDVFDVSIEYFGSSEQGSAKATFTRKK